MTTKKEEVKKETPKPKEKKKKKPFAEFIGKKTNSGDEVIAINKKVIKRVNQAPVDMVEVRTLSGRATVVKESELKGFVGVKKKKDKK